MTMLTYRDVLDNLRAAAMLHLEVLETQAYAWRTSDNAKQSRINKISMAKSMVRVTDRVDFILDCLSGLDSEDDVLKTLLKALGCMDSKVHEEIWTWIEQRLIEARSEGP